MDIEFVLSHANGSGIEMIGPDYLKGHLAMGVPYLVVLIFWMLWGTFGNILIITTVLTDKVRIYYNNLGYLYGGIFSRNLEFSEN